MFLLTLGKRLHHRRNLTETTLLVTFDDFSCPLLYAQFWVQISKNAELLAFGGKGGGGGTTEKGGKCTDPIIKHREPFGFGAVKNT